MARTYTLELSDIEIDSGVTLEQVQDLLPKGLFIENGEKFVLPADTAPALAGSVARCAFGADAQFLGLNQLSQPVYGRTPTLW